MEICEAVGVGIVTVFWCVVDFVLLLNEPLAEGLSSTIGVSPSALELGVFLFGCFASWGAHKAAEAAQDQRLRYILGRPCIGWLL